MDPVFNYFQARAAANKSQTKVTAEFPEAQTTRLHVAVPLVQLAMQLTLMFP